MWTLLVSFVLASLACVACAQDSVEAPNFSIYRHVKSGDPLTAYQSDAVAAWMLTDTFGQWSPTYQPLVRVQTLAARGMVLVCVVNTEGAESDACYTFDGSRHNHHRQFTSDELLNLRFAIFDLPASSVTPPVERLVVVGFRDDQRWIVRSYDDAALPDAVRRIQGLIGQDYKVLEAFDPKVSFSLNLGIKQNLRGLKAFDPKMPFNTGWDE